MPSDPDPDADPFRPPPANTEVGCLHCQEVYDSYRIEWREDVGPDGRAEGFWCCPIPGCDGRGFGFDILPTDPEWVDEDGNRMWTDDADGEEDEDFDDLPDDAPPSDPNAPPDDHREDIPY